MQMSALQAGELIDLRGQLIFYGHDLADSLYIELSFLRETDRQRAAVEDADPQSLFLFLMQVLRAGWETNRFLAAWEKFLTL